MRRIEDANELAIALFPPDAAAAGAAEAADIYAAEGGEGGSHHQGNGGKRRHSVHQQKGGDKGSPSLGGAAQLCMLNHTHLTPIARVRKASEEDLQHP